MKKLFAITSLTILAIFAAPTRAAPKTVILSVPGMDCPVCPITVKKALGKVAGVTRAEVNFDTKEAVVTFDDAKTNVEALRKATSNAGYPSSIKE